MKDSRCNAPTTVPRVQHRNRVGLPSTGIAVGLAALFAALPASADDGPVLPAARPGDTAITEAALIGTGGQVYQFDATSKKPRWIRRSAGGCTADITGAVLLPTSAAKIKAAHGEPSTPRILIAGKSAPLFRWTAGVWSSMPVGQKGKTILGTGPLPSVAIGRQVFVWHNDQMTRVATAATAVVGLWAASPTDVRVSTDKALFRLRGKAFAPIALRTTNLPLGRIVGGTKPLLVAGSKLIDIERGRSTDVGGLVQLASAATAASGGNATTFAAVVIPSANTTLALKLLTFSGAAPATSVNIAGPVDATSAVGLLVDRTGRILLTTATKTWLFQDGTWTAATLDSELGPLKPGPGPAFTQ
ncbi:MAG: hypothetical protein KBG15_16905 [Kofleriaceae bacterium]|nr:hypothetical protein [Kofleriaceae bacterium]